MIRFDESRAAARKRFVLLSKARHAPRAVPRPVPPTGLVQAYTRVLLDVSAAMDAIIYRALESERLIRRDEEAQLAPELTPAQVKALARRLTAALGKVASSQSLIGRINALAANVGKYSRAQWERQLRQSMGISAVADIDLAHVIEEFRAYNLELITKLAANKVERVRQVIVEHPGARVESLTHQIENAVDATTSHAALIARDQVLKLNSQITEARHIAAGITEYTWSTSEDERVRPDHKRLDGKRFPYDHPPITDLRTGARNSPGQDFQCRCLAIPVLPGID